MKTLRTLLFMCVIPFACAPSPLTHRVVKPAAGPDVPKIVIFESSARYDQPIKGFVDAVDAEVHEIILNESDEDSVAALVAQRPTIVFALGTRATLLAANALPNTPIVCAMVAEHRSARLQALKNVIGIAFEAPPLQEFSQFKMVLPAMKRVLVVHSKKSAALIRDAQREVRALDIELVPVEISRAEQIAAAVASAAQQGIDAVWLPTDPLLVTKLGFAAVRKAADDAKVPLIASISDYFAKHGAFAAVSIDFTSLGAQAAARVRAVLQHGLPPPSEPRFEVPIGATLVVNIGVGERLSIEVPPDVIPFLKPVEGDQTAAK